MLLTKTEEKEMLLAHGKHFFATCNDCDKLIPVGALYTVLKWERRKDGLTFLGAIPSRVRCMACEDEKRGRKKDEDVKPVDLTKLIARGIRRIFKKDPTPLSSDDVISKLRRRKIYKGCKTNAIKKVLKLLKEKRQLTRRNKLWQLVKKG